MVEHLTTGAVQHCLTAHYRQTGEKLTYPDAIARAFRWGLASNGSAVRPDFLSWDGQDFAQLRAIAADTPLSLGQRKYLDIPMATLVSDESLVFAQRDISALLFANYESTPLHRHHFFEMVYLLEGECELEFESETHLLRAGDMCLTAPDTFHAARPVEEGLALHISIRHSTFETVFFGMLSEEHLLSTFFRQCLYRTDPSYILFDTDLDSRLLHLLRHILHESNTPDHYANQVCVHYMSILFTEIMRGSGQVRRCPMSASRSSAVIPAVLLYLKQNYRDVSLPKLAALFHYDPSYLSRQLKHHTGLSFSEIVTRHRLERAAFLLEHTTETLENIAAAVGCHSADHLSRLFRLQHGMPPGQYRIAKTTHKRNTSCAFGDGE